jgi:hypothetical protein
MISGAAQLSGSPSHIHEQCPQAELKPAAFANWRVGVGRINVGRILDHVTIVAARG